MKDRAWLSSSGWQVAFAVVYGPFGKLKLRQGVRVKSFAADLCFHETTLISIRGANFCAVIAVKAIKRR